MTAASKFFMLLPMKIPALRILFLSFACWADVLAESPAPRAVEVAEEAIRRADATKLDGWAFTVTTTEEGKKTVETHNPAAPNEQRWTLVLKDGKPPTEKELRKYAEERRRARSKEQRLSSLVDKASLELEGEDAERLTFRFRMKSDGDDAKLLAGKIRGTLVVRRDGPNVESLEIANTEKISKAGVFSLSEFQTRIRFRPAPERPESLIESVTARVRGRALLVKSLDADTETTFSDFRWVGKP